jgi:ribosome-associated protein
MRATLCGVDDDGAVLRVTGSVAIPLHELEWRFTPSSGPGGQHANKASTRAEVRLDVETSSAFGPRQRQRVIAALGPIVRVAADDERSQSRNRALALERLAARLRAALVVARPRRDTKPSKAAQQRRIDAKRRRSTTKQQRSWRPEG